MRFLVSLVLVRRSSGIAAPPPSASSAEDAGAWPEILVSVGFRPRPPASPASSSRAAAPPLPREWPARVENGALPDPRRRILARRTSSVSAATADERPRHQPHRRAPPRRSPSSGRTGSSSPASISRPRARVFARERWTGAPWSPGLRRGAGRGAMGRRLARRARLRALSLSVERPLRSRPRIRRSARTASGPSSIPPTAPASISTTSRARWRKAGIAALHVAAWHFFEPTRSSDAYLQQPDRGLPPPGHPGLRLARTPACQREILGTTTPNGARRPPSCRTPSSTGASS